MLSKLEYLAAGSTLVNGGTSYPQLANCFVMEMQDDIEHIAKTTRDVMWLTKGTGGIATLTTATIATPPQKWGAKYRARALPRGSHPRRLLEVTAATAPLLLGLGLFMGVGAGLLGIGGGVIATPAIMLFLGGSDVAAKSISLLAMAPGALSGSILHIRLFLRPNQNLITSSKSKRQTLFNERPVGCAEA